jgi:hypothetical protein
MMVTPFSVTYISSLLVSSQLPPPTAAKSMMTLPGFITSTASFNISFGDGLPGIAAVVIAMSVSFNIFLKVSCCAFLNSSELSFA